MIKGKTKSGFEFCINPDDLDDMRFIDALASLDKNNFIAMSEVADFMFDKEQKKAIYAHLANLDEKGKVRTEAFIKEVIEILTYNEDTKN